MATDFSCASFFLFTDKQIIFFSIDVFIFLAFFFIKLNLNSGAQRTFQKALVGY